MIKGKLAVIFLRPFEGASVSYPNPSLVLEPR